MGGRPGSLDRRRHSVRIEHRMPTSKLEEVVVRSVFGFITSPLTSGPGSFADPADFHFFLRCRTDSRPPEFQVARLRAAGQGRPFCASRHEAEEESGHRASLYDGSKTRSWGIAAASGPHSRRGPGIADWRSGFVVGRGLILGRKSSIPRPWHLGDLFTDRPHCRPVC